MTWVDPVCAMSVEAPSAPRLIFNGVEYRFCSDMCLSAFSERPGRYLKDGDNPYLEHVIVETTAQGANAHRKDDYV